MSSRAPRFISFSLGLFLLASTTGCTSTPEPESSAAEAYVPQLTEVWKLEAGLDRPESVIYDAGNDVLYITNIVGDGAEMDGNGYIAKVSPEGEMLEQAWVSGLNAPKGIAIAGDRLWSSDLNALVEIALPSGEIQNRYEVEGDVYLNDVTVHSDGSVFVTDSRYSKVYKFDGTTLDLWFEGDQIQMPNGAHVIGDELVVVAGDVSAENPGQSRYFQAVSLADKSVRTLAGSTPNGALDAVEPDDKGGIFTSGWMSGRLMYFQEGSGVTLLKQLGQGAADVDFIKESRMLYVPVMQEGQLIAYSVE